MYAICIVNKKNWSSVRKLSVSKVIGTFFKEKRMSARIKTKKNEFWI